MRTFFSLSFLLTCCCAAAADSSLPYKELGEALADDTTAQGWYNLRVMEYSKAMEKHAKEVEKQLEAANGERDNISSRITGTTDSGAKKSVANVTGLAGTVSSNMPARPTDMDPEAYEDVKTKVEIIETNCARIRTLLQNAKAAADSAKGSESIKVLHEAVEKLAKFDAEIKGCFARIKYMPDAERQNFPSVKENESFKRAFHMREVYARTARAEAKEAAVQALKARVDEYKCLFNAVCMELQSEFEAEEPNTPDPEDEIELESEKADKEAAQKAAAEKAAKEKAATPPPKVVAAPPPGQQPKKDGSPAAPVQPPPAKPSTLARYKGQAAALKMKAEEMRVKNEKLAMEDPDISKHRQAALASIQTACLEAETRLKAYRNVRKFLRKYESASDPQARKLAGLASRLKTGFFESYDEYIAALEAVSNERQNLASKTSNVITESKKLVGSSISD